MAILHYPSHIGTDDSENPGWIEISIFERKSPKVSVPDSTINLYMPEQLRNPNVVSWGNDSLGTLGNMAVGQSYDDASNGAISRAFHQVAASAGSYMLKAGGGNVSADTLLGASGKVKNPFLIALFKGVDFRTFEMEFKFVPFSESDCNSIQNIIKTLRASSLPDNSQGDTILGYPKEFEIRYIWKGQENRYLNKFKRCVLTGIDVNYTGMGQWAVMRNGFPAEIFLTLRFSEIEILLRKDIEEGY